MNISKRLDAIVLGLIIGTLMGSLTALILVSGYRLGNYLGTIT